MSQTTALPCKKDLFSLPADAHYLNCAYMSPLSNRVVEVGKHGIERKQVPFQIRPADFFEDGDRLRSLFARLVNIAEPTRVAIIPSASYGLAQAGRNTPVVPGQKIVTVHEQFPSNVYVWRRIAAAAGARVEVVQSPVDGAGRAEAWNAALLEAIGPSTAIVALGQVHWTDGTLFDLEAIGARARAMGAAVIVDGTQSVGAYPFDVQRLQPDALVCAGYKWLMGPYSLGVAYYGPRYDDGAPLEETWMAREGSEDFSGLTLYGERYRPGSVRYDVGESSNFILVPMLSAAVEQLLEWTPAAIDTYGRGLTDALVSDLREQGHRVTEDGWRGGHLFGVRLGASMDLAELQRRLRQHGVFVSIRGSAVRVSVHVFNDGADIAALQRALGI